MVFTTRVGIDQSREDFKAIFHFVLSARAGEARFVFEAHRARMSRLSKAASTARESKRDGKQAL